MSNYDKSEVIKVLNLVLSYNIESSSILTIVNYMWHKDKISRSEYYSFRNWLDTTNHRYGGFPETATQKIEFVNNALKELE